MHTALTVDMNSHRLLTKVFVLTACVVAPGVASAAGPTGFQSMTSQYRQGTSAFGSVEKNAPKSSAPSRANAPASGETRLKASDGIQSIRKYPGVDADRKATREASAQTKVVTGSITSHRDVPRNHSVYVPGSAPRVTETRTITAKHENGKLVTVSKATEQTEAGRLVGKTAPVPERKWDKVSVTRSGDNGVSRTTTMQSWRSVTEKNGSLAERTAAAKAPARSMAGASIEHKTESPTATHAVRYVIPPPARVNVPYQGGTVATNKTLVRNEVERNPSTGNLERVQKAFVENRTTGQYESADRKP